MQTEDFTLDHEGDKTPWRLFTPEDAAKDWAVLWLQGFTSTIEGHTEGVVRMVQGTGTTFAMLNYAGHGNHPVPLARATRAQQFQEVVGAYDELVKRGYQNIVAIGGSFGAYMAALLASERPLETLVLRAPAIYDDAEFELPFRATRSGKSKERSDIWRESITPDMQNRALDAVRSFAGDTFVIEHELDSVINAAIPQAYFAAAQHPNYIVIRGCDHSPKLMPHPPKYFAIIEHWLQTIILAAQLNGVDKAR